MNRAVRLNKTIDDGARLTAQLISTTNQADMNPAVFGSVSALTLMAALKGEVPFFDRSEQRQDGLCTLDAGSVVYAWILLSDGQRSCAYFAPIKYIDVSSAAGQMMRINDSLNRAAQRLSCTLHMVSNGEIDSEAAEIIEASCAVFI